jgi:hypothetical protein
MCCLWKLSRRSECCSVTFCLSIEQRNSGVHWCKYSFHHGAHYVLHWNYVRMCVCVCVCVCVCENFVRNIFLSFCLLRNDMQSTGKNFMTLCVCLQFLCEIVAFIWPCGIFLCPHSVSEDTSAACNIWLLVHSTLLYSFALSGSPSFIDQTSCGCSLILLDSVCILLSFFTLFHIISLRERLLHVQ